MDKVAVHTGIGGDERMRARVREQAAPGSSSCAIVKRAELITGACSQARSLIGAAWGSFAAGIAIGDAAVRRA